MSCLQFGSQPRQPFSKCWPHICNRGAVGFEATNWSMPQNTATANKTFRMRFVDSRHVKPHTKCNINTINTHTRAHARFHRLYSQCIYSVVIAIVQLQGPYNSSGERCGNARKCVDISQTTHKTNINNEITFKWQLNFARGVPAASGVERQGW